MPKNIIRIIDVTNRDGVQTSRLGLAKIEKTMVNKYLNEMGVYMSECGFPTTKHERNYINGNVDLVKKGVFAPMHLAGWIRAIPEDVEEAVKQTEIKHLNLSASTSEQMIMGKYQGKKTKKDILELMIKAVDKAKKAGITLIGVNAEDASRTDMDFLIEFGMAAKEHGAERLRYCDTLGYDDPFSIYQRAKQLAEAVQMPVDIHCHNDLGMAVACSIAGAKGVIDAGQDAFINTTVNGMGERAGNADLVSIILALKYSGTMGPLKLLDPKISLSKAWKLAHYASMCFKVPIPINQPGVGGNAFAHASGIHADGALKDSKNYELYDLEELGRGEPELVETGRMITTGEYSGITGFKHVYGKLAVKFKDEEEARRILELVRYANVLKQKPLNEDELMFIAKYPEEVKEIMTIEPLI